MFSRIDEFEKAYLSMNFISECSVKRTDLRFWQYAKAYSPILDTCGGIIIVSINDSTNAFSSITFNCDFLSKMTDLIFDF